MLKITLEREVETRRFFKRASDDAKVMAAATADELARRTLQYVLEAIRTGSKTGVVYRRSNPSRIHQASAPGQAPADDLGNLAASYHVRKRKVNQYVHERAVGSNSPVASWLEFGTLRIFARPHLSPSATRAVKELPNIIKGVRRGVFK